MGIVADGGTIVMAASLTEGLGSEEFQHHIRTSRYMKALSERGPTPHTCEMDEWQLLMLSKVLDRCKVKIVTHGLSADVLKRCNVEPATTVEEAVAASLAEYGPQARVAVVPKGPYVLPCVGVR
jgi:nickel-dependent lactate racemase